jgi:N-methylhydantoinase B/oxoprolinase/acetone carboxylase alpha subunit
MTSGSDFDPISLEIMWSRLIGIADDMWTTVLRTAVSTIIGAAQDFGCEVLDAGGASVAHSNRSMPSFNVIMPGVVRGVLAKHPRHEMRPGDVFITNDPWLCAGHLDDIAIVTPVFRGDRLVAFTASIAHSSSIGGSLSNRTARDVYEEGLRIPVLKLYDRGAPNTTAFELISENVRAPQMVLTDIEAQVTANGLGASRVLAFLDEYRLDDLSALATTIQAHSEAAMRAALAAVPDGVYESEVCADGLDVPVRLQCRITIEGERLHVDFAGSDPQQPRGGINCTMSYTLAHTLYPLKCLFSPTVPANEGTYRPITISAPPGSILNCEQPASVRSRPRTGWHIHPMLFQALHEILPDRVQAGNGLMQTFNVYGQEPDGEFYNAHFLLAGGRGASAGRDGIGRNGFPSSARNVAVEDLELRAPILVRQRGLRPDSAGDGRWRGAHGHHIVVSALPDAAGPLTLYVDPDRMRFPAAGLAGGSAAPLATIARNGVPLTIEDLASGQIRLDSPADRVEMKLSGGGGYGRPAERDPDLIEADLRQGLRSTP